MTCNRHRARRGGMNQTGLALAVTVPLEGPLGGPRLKAAPSSRLSFCTTARRVRAHRNKPQELCDKNHGNESPESSCYGPSGCTCADDGMVTVGQARWSTRRSDTPRWRVKRTRASGNAKHFDLRCSHKCSEGAQKNKGRCFGPGQQSAITKAGIRAVAEIDTTTPRLDP